MTTETNKQESESLVKTPVISVHVNGQAHTTNGGTSVAKFLESLALRGGPVAVELNLEVVPSTQHSETFLSEGDQLEIVSLTGGG